MATKMGAPGVRIELKDSSQYTVIENPNAIGAIVGFAPKGELNKVTKLTNTASMDRTFGIGFNNWKYNQGLYAARAVLDAGGHVQYVRPYGEEIDMSDARKRDLKTDAFVVSFNRNAAQESETGGTSLNIEYFAATRYKADGASGYGVTRKINNISETVASGSNIDFRLFADDSFKDSDKARGKSDAVLFALMAADPSSARRAISTFEIVGQPNDLADSDPDTFRVTLAVNPAFIVGDTVYGPADNNTKTLCKFIVTAIDGKDVDITAADEETHNALMLGYKPSTVLMYSPEDAISEDDSDYLTVKTAVTGRGAKLFSSLKVDSEGMKDLAGRTVHNGEFFYVNDQSCNRVAVRVANSNVVQEVNGIILRDIVDLSEPISIDGIVLNGVLSGEILTLSWNIEEFLIEDGAAEGAWVVTGTHQGTFKYVETADGAVLYVDNAPTLASDTVTTETRRIGEVLRVYNYATGWSDDIDAVTFNVPAAGEAETEDEYAIRFRNALVAVFTGARLGYARNAVVNDLDMKADEFIAGKTKNIKVTSGSAFDYNVGDIVAVIRGTSDSHYQTTFDSPISGKNILMISTVTAISGFTNEVILKDAVDTVFVDTVIDNTTPDAPVFKREYVQLQLINLTATNKTVYAGSTTNVLTKEMTDEYTYVGQDGQYVKFVSSIVYKVNDNVHVVYTDGSQVTQDLPITGVSVDGDVYTYTIDLLSTAGVTYSITAKHFEPAYESLIDLYLVGNYDITVNSKVQITTYPVVVDNKLVGTESPIQYQIPYEKENTAVIVQSEKVLRDSEIGANFVGLGLANIRYEDINFTGVTEKVYDLTSVGESVARLYMACTYRFNGQVYNFDGTVVEYIYNDTQLYIGDTAESELEGTGLKFVLNESGILDSFLDDESWDLSETIVNGIPTSSVTGVSFNVNDPAVKWNAIWSYEPMNNNNTSTLATAYSLFLDKDKADQTFFVAAGNDINNFGWAGRESLNTTVIQAILNICELRKDCFALFDGVAEQNIDNALKKDVVRFPSTLGRWGAIYDARPLFYDSMITRRNVEIAPSITMASLITANRSGAIFWYVPAGKDTGIVPSAWCTRVKFERKFNYPEDPDSDIARLCDAHVNPFRTNDDGIFCWGDFTMQMEDSAFNQIHVAMLIAGIHKIFYKYLDGKVFRLNTAALRSQISSDLQAKLNMMRDSNPSAFYDAIAICDDTNNPPEVIDQNKLYVDLKLKPTKSTRYIYLRTEVLATSSGNSITISNV